jgi:hypothetical protein
MTRLCQHLFIIHVRQFHIVVRIHIYIFIRKERQKNCWLERQVSKRLVRETKFRLCFVYKVPRSLSHKLVDGNNPSDIEEIGAVKSGPQVSKSTIVIVRMNSPVEGMHLHYTLYSNITC